MAKQPKRILIVEPDRPTAMSLAGLLQPGPDGYDVDIAESVTEAREKARTVNFHCFIVDVNLPEMDGTEAAQELKSIDRQTPVIMTSEDNTAEQEKQVRQQDVYYYHVRSFDPDELKSAVDSIFERELAAEGGESKGVRPKKLASAGKSRAKAPAAGAAPKAWVGGRLICQKCFYQVARNPDQPAQATCPRCGAKMSAALFMM